MIKLYRKRSTGNPTLFKGKDNHEVSFTEFLNSILYYFEIWGLSGLVSKALLYFDVLGWVFFLIFMTALFITFGLVFFK